MSSLMALQDRLNRSIVFTLVVRVLGEADPKGSLISALRATGAKIADIEIAEIEDSTNNLIYDITLFTTGDAQMAAARTAAQAIDGIEVVDVVDVAMEAHRGGSCKMVAASPIESNTDLRIVYTPGVARVCKAIEAKPELADDFTGIKNTVAIVTNGTAILGLGDIGCVPGMPVMEGKSAIFAEFAGISAIPMLVDTKDPEKFVETVCTIAKTFGAIQVEDVAAPECFYITNELDRRLDIPVMHDDQYGTATIVLAGLYSALKKTGKKMETLEVCILGAGAAGTAIADLLLKAGAKDVVLCDRYGAISKGRSNMNSAKQELATRTNKKNVQGDLAAVIKGKDLFIGCSGPNLVSKEMIASMNKGPIVFALANPVSEISKDDALAAGASIYADGRTMNNAIAYPGIFRGALDAKSKVIDIPMMQAAAHALAEIVPDGQLLPEMMDPQTHQTVAQAVMKCVKK